jgi:hypothetical protein
MAQDMSDYLLPRTQVETRAVSQAKEFNSTIEQEATSFINFHIHQEIGWTGGRIDFPLKIDMLVKNYPPELAASIFMRFPEDAKRRAIDLFRSMDIHWSPFPVEGDSVGRTGSAERAAEAMVCILSIMEPSEAARVAGNLTSGTRTMVKAACERIQREYETQVGKPSVAPVEAAMVFIEAGEFIMGTSPEQAALIVKKLRNWQLSWFEREMPQRRVILMGIGLTNTLLRMPHTRHSPTLPDILYLGKVRPWQGRTTGIEALSLIRKGRATIQSFL